MLWPDFNMVAFHTKIFLMQITLDNVSEVHLGCVVQLGIFSIPGDIMSTVGDIMSTMEGVQYTGKIS